MVKKEIQKLYEEKKADNVNIILNKSVKGVFDAYILKKNIPRLSNLYNDLKILTKKMKENNEENIEKYLNKNKNTALNLERIFIKKSSRIKVNFGIFKIYSYTDFVYMYMFIIWQK